MYRVKDIPDDDLDVFSKIYCRHLKELGVYAPVKKYFSEEIHKSIKNYMLSEKCDARIISDLVTIAWHPIYNATKLGVKSSLVIICILLDDKFYNFIRRININAFNFTDYISKVRQSILREFDFLVELDDFNYEDITKNEINMLNDIRNTFINRFGEEPFRNDLEKEKFLNRLRKCKNI